jgi:alanine-synthesizing transaminase
MPTQAQVPVASRIHGFTYAIRNVVAEARKVEAAGLAVRYLNIGDPIPFGFKTPPHLIEAVDRAMRDGHNGYTASVGIPSAREAVAAEYESRGMPVGADRVILTAGTSEGIELALGAMADAGDEVLVPTPTYPLYTAVLAKLGARAVYYRTDPGNGWQPDLADIKAKITSLTRALVVIDPNNPTGAVYPEAIRRALILSFSSLSKAYIAPGWRAGWLSVGRSSRLDDVLAAIKKLADGRLCSTGPMQYAVEAALTGDRGHQREFVRELSMRAALTTSRLNAVPGLSCVPPHAAFYAMPKVALPPGVTDEDYVLALLRKTGILCVYGSGFGLPAADGFFRVVFLAQPDALSAIYDDIATFTADFLS